MCPCQLTRMLRHIPLVVSHQFSLLDRSHSLVLTWYDSSLNVVEYSDLIRSGHYHLTCLFELHPARTQEFQVYSSYCK